MTTKHRCVRLLTLIACVLLLSACGDDIGYTYSDYRCNLYLDNSVHQDPALSTAMNSQSPGTFCTVSYKYSGTYYYVFKTNLGQTSESIFNAIDQQRDNHLRIGQNNGIIVGFGNLSTPAEFYAYDAECPNCYDANALPVRSYKLSVSGAGIATCNNCQRTYNLNTGGNIASGDRGTPLTRYRASTTGPFGTLYVN